jgi:hypothetical protein
VKARMLVLLTLLIQSPAAEGGEKEDRLAYEAMFPDIEVRHGVHHRSLVVLPLVLRDGVEPISGPVRGRERISWSVLGDRSRSDIVSIVLAKGETKEPEPPVILPAGVLLRGDGRERILSRPLLLTPGETALVRARFCDAIEKPLREPPVTGYRHGRLSPPDQRRFDLLYRDPAALLDIQRIQAILAGLPDTCRNVEDVLRASKLKARVDATKAALAPVVQAYGGATVGHLVLLGYRPIEILLASSPTTYRSLTGESFHGLAVTLAIWEEFLAKGGLASAEPDWKAVLPAARKVLAAMPKRSVRVRPLRLHAHEKGGSRTLFVLGPKPHKSLDDRSRLIGRLLLDGEGRGLFLEAYPSGADRPFPAPLLKPGGRPADSRPDIRSGTLTMQFLKRLLGRRAAGGGGR